MRAGRPWRCGAPGGPPGPACAARYRPPGLVDNSLSSNRWPNSPFTARGSISGLREIDRRRSRRRRAVAPAQPRRLRDHGPDGGRSRQPGPARFRFRARATAPRNEVVETSGRDWLAGPGGKEPPRDTGREVVGGLPTTSALRQRNSRNCQRAWAGTGSSETGYPVTRGVTPARCQLHRLGVRHMALRGHDASLWGSRRRQRAGRAILRPPLHRPRWNGQEDRFQRMNETRAWLLIVRAVLGIWAAAVFVGCFMAIVGWLPE